MRKQTVVALLTFAAVAVAASAQAQIRFGVLPRLSATEMNKMFAPLAAFLEKETGKPVQLIVPKDFDAFVAMAKAGQFDIAFANPSVFVDLKATASAQPLAMSVETGTGATFTGCFLVKKGSPIKSVADVKGHKVIFVDDQSAGGYQVQVLAMKKAGLKGSDMTVLPFAKKHTNVALAIQNGTAEVGGVRTADLPKISQEASVPDVVVLAETDRIPNWPMFSFPKLDAGTSDKVRVALLTLAPKSAAAAILSGARLDGFVKTSDQDFETIRAMREAVRSF